MVLDPAAGLLLCKGQQTWTVVPLTGGSSQPRRTGIDDRPWMETYLGSRGCVRGRAWAWYPFHVLGVGGPLQHLKASSPEAVEDAKLATHTYNLPARRGTELEG